MMGSGSPSQLDETEYDVIESALAETERGRRFLAEFARRHRGADTDMLLQAIHRLEGVVSRDAAPAAEPSESHSDFSAIAQGIARTRVAIAALTPSDGEEGDPASPDTLESFLHKAERATAEILGAAEAIQEAAWGLREKGADTELCDVLDRRAITIYTACSAQDLAIQRTGLVVSALCEIEARIGERIGEAAGASRHDELSFAALPPLPEAESEEHHLDFVPSPAEDEAPAAAPEPEAAVKEPEERAPAIREPDESDDLALAFGDLDSLSIEEKIALFS